MKLTSFGLLFRLALVGAALLGAQSFASAQPPPCGGEGQRACTVSPAAYVGKKPSACPQGSFFDPIDGGTCWSCPARYIRSVTHVKSADACVLLASEEFRRANRHGRGTGLLGTDCPRGQFWDPNGYCWSCPAGFGRTAHAVTDGRACARGVASRAGRATLVSSLTCPSGSFFDLIDGGTCWRCPQGYNRTLAQVKAADACATTLLAGAAAEAGTCRAGLVNTGGTCTRQGTCGGANQRPCLIGERIPSCNAGLREDFKANRCLPLRAGETPLTAGLASLGDFYSDGLRAACRQLVGVVRLEAGTELAVGANCSKDILGGVSCGFLVDSLGGGYASTAGAILSSGATAQQFQAAVDRAYAGKCSRYAERLTRATRGPRGGGAFGTDCPRGQFWDPNGNCYACPQGYTRTLNPVESAGACVDKMGGELLRSACSVQEAVGTMFAAPAACSIEMLKGGLIEGAQLDFTRASQDVCMSTGDFIYVFLDAVRYVGSRPEESAGKIQSSLQALISKVQNSPAYRRTMTGAAAGSAALSGAALARKLQQFPACGQLIPPAKQPAPAPPAPAAPPPPPPETVTILNSTKGPVNVCGYRAYQEVLSECFLLQPGEHANWNPRWANDRGKIYRYHLRVHAPSPAKTSIALGDLLCEARDRRESRMEIQPGQTVGTAPCRITPR